MALIHTHCPDCHEFHPPDETCPNSIPEQSEYTDDTGARHSLWVDAEGNANACIEFTMGDGQ